MSRKPKQIAVIGAGITGLSAAYYAQQFFQEQDIPFELTLLEKDSRLGGRINTLHKEGFVIERGPDSFLSRKLPIIHLTKELGLENELTGTNPNARKTYILSKGRLHRMPPGLMLGIPTELKPFIQTKLISPLGKARAALDLILPRRRESGDESLGSFLKRRLGREIHDRIAEPLLAGIYAGDTAKLSLQATFPQFKQAEEKKRSLILSMRANKRQLPNTEGLPELAKESVFLTYKQGLSTLVNRLEEVLADQVEIVKGRTLTSISKLEHGYELELDQGEVLEADGLILTLPPPVLARLLSEHVPSASQFEEVNYVSVANVVLAYDAEDIEYPLDGTGFVVPNDEGRQITACTWTSSKWVHTAPPGKVLIRCYVGRAGAEEIVFESDEAILTKVQHDLKALMGITATPLFYEITRLPHSMPQYPLGHLEKIRQVRKDMTVSLPGVYIAGGGLEGVGIPDCIAQGKTAARQLVDYFL